MKLFTFSSHESFHSTTGEITDVRDEQSTASEAQQPAQPAELDPSIKQTHSLSMPPTGKEVDDKTMKKGFEDLDGKGSLQISHPAASSDNTPAASLSPHHFHPFLAPTNEIESERET